MDKEDRKERARNKDSHDREEEWRGEGKYGVGKDINRKGNMH